LPLAGLRTLSDADMAALIDRDYAIAAIVDGLEIALGRRPSTITRVKGARGAHPASPSMTKVDVQAACRCAELLLKHVGPA